MLDTYSSFTALQVEQAGRLLTVSLNRPESLNAVNSVLHADLETLWTVVRRDNSVGAVLLRGNGRAFCAGGDVKWMASTAAEADAPSQPGPAERAAELLVSAKSIVANMLEVGQPIVCAVQGYAMGLGATIALFCDVVVAAEDAVFADTHVTVGIVAGDGGAVIWPLLMPINTAKYYLLTGERLTGSEAKELGLVQKVVPLDQLETTAHGIAQRLADGPSLAIQFTKTTVNKVLRERVNLLLDTSLALEASSFFTADHAEAARSFVERRRPDFTGR
jgi:enoyl-CoA hydratase